MDTPLKTVFYSIERAIKEYRKFVQRNLSAVDPDITVDQALILMIIDQDESVSQSELSELLFRDKASMTRTVKLMVMHGIVSQSSDSMDGRKRNLKLTGAGRILLKKISPIVQNNRIQAARGLSTSDIRMLTSSLDRITANCRPGNE